MSMTGGVELSSQRNRRILLVDDDQDVVTVVNQVLLMLGYQVSAHTSSLEALSVFQANPLGFDVIISDCSMPEMTGIEFAAKVFSLCPDKPFILASGQNSLSVEELRQMGIREFVQKPYAVDMLAGAIATALGEDAIASMDPQSMGLVVGKSAASAVSG